MRKATENPFVTISYTINTTNFVNTDDGNETVYVSVIMINIRLLLLLLS